MKLLELLKDIPVLESNVRMDLDIAHVAYDSRKVEWFFEFHYTDIYIYQSGGSRSWRQCFTGVVFTGC